MALSSTPLKIAGQIDRITFKSDETGWAVMQLKVDAKQHPACPYANKKGRLPIVGHLGLLNVGDVVVVEGELDRHPQHGLQVKVAGYQVLTPTTLAGVEAYLAGCMKQIGPYRAKLITRHFGADALSVLDETPDRLNEVDGIGRTLVQYIKENWAQTRALRSVHLFLASVGVNPAYAERFIRKYGPAAPETVKADPYCLARDIDGFGFIKADEVAAKLGVTGMSPLRVRAAMEHVLYDRMTSVGDCFQYRAELIPAAIELLRLAAITPDYVEPILAESVAKGYLAAEDTRIYLPSMKQTEDSAAEHLQRLVTGPVPVALQDVEGNCRAALKSSPVPLADLQVQAIRTSLGSKVSIITGGPGTGKTTILKALVHGLQHAGIRVSLFAPTGRAAKRMREVIGQPASTIHRELFARLRRVKEDGGDMNAVKFNGEVLVIDEMSMVDLKLINWLLSFCNDNVVLVLIGDSDQLPSVGAGAVLRDLVACGQIPCVKLTTIFRQAAGSDIIVNAHRINSGDMPKLVRFGAAYGMPSTDMLAVVSEDPDHLRMAAIYCATTLARHMGFDPITECQVLAPQHKGSLGVAQLNRELQAAVNPNPPDFLTRGQEHPVLWGIGDKLMQLVNNYDLDLMNGDIATIQEIVRDKDGLVTDLLVARDGESIQVPNTNFHKMVLAYASTVHKSQGSQFPMLVLCLHTQHFIMLQRNLLYTGITRAERLCVVCGSETAISMAVRNNKIIKRNTWLAEKVAGLCRGGIARAG